MARSRGLIWLVAGLFLALVAGLLAFQALNRATAIPSEVAISSPTAKVVVLARDVPSRTYLEVGDVRIVDVPVDVLPTGIVTSLEDAIGMLTLADLFEGETLLADRLVDPTVVARNGRMAVALVEDQVLAAIPAQDVMSRAKVLQPGDRVDIHFSLDFPVERGIGIEATGDEEQATFALLQNVQIAGLVGPTFAPTVSEDPDNLDSEVGVPDSLLVTLTPQDALTLKYALDMGGMMDIVLRAPGVDRPFETNPVDPDYLINRYAIPFERNR